MIRYEEGNEDQRLKALNGMNRLKFSLSETQQMPNVMEDAELYAQAQSDKDM